MSYATKANRTNPLAAVGALGIPAAFGALLVVGLAVTATLPPEDKPLEGFQVKIEPVVVPPDPVPTPDTPTSNREVPQPTPTYTPPPQPDGPVDVNVGLNKPITSLPGVGDGIGDTLGPIDFGGPTFDRGPNFDPVAASPRGNPGNWITDIDYRPSWINRGLKGVAGFTLSLDSSGRVSDCAITRSTGHAVLDKATCDLLRKRARFEPARGTSGEAVAGSFSSSVNWKIPE